MTRCASDPSAGGDRARTRSRVLRGDLCTDSRQLTKDCLFVALKGERFDGHDFLSAAIEAGAAGLVVERGRAAAIDAPQVAVFEVKDTLQALGGLARFHRQRFKVPIGRRHRLQRQDDDQGTGGVSILAMRGPALKTEGNLNNEIGVPLTLFGLEPSHRAAVIEMGMNRPRRDRAASPTSPGPTPGSSPSYSQLTSKGWAPSRGWPRPRASCSAGWGRAGPRW